MGLAMRTVAGLLDRNNARVRRVDAVRSNPRPVDSLPWHTALAGHVDTIRDEWVAFEAAGGVLPRIEDVLAESQGNEGTWRFGLLVSRGRPLDCVASTFPRTLDALGDVPGLRSAMWSLLEPEAELLEHTGPNAGVLRYHLGVACGTGAGLEVAGTTVPYRDGDGILFDDTAPHRAWNHGPRARVTLFCEIDRPLPRSARVANAFTQAVLGLDRRYRQAPQRATEWYLALNPRLMGPRL